MAIIFIIIGIIFIMSKGNACDFIAGYNMKSQDERKKYNEIKICKSFGKANMSWAIYFIVGVIVDYIKPGVGIKIASLLLVITVIFFIIFINIKFDKKYKY
jgi:hypothetical protein